MSIIVILPFSIAASPFIEHFDYIYFDFHKVV